MAPLALQALLQRIHLHFQDCGARVFNGLGRIRDWMSELRSILACLTA